MDLNLLLMANIVLFYSNGVFYGSGDYTNGLYILDFEMSMLNINYKRNRLDN